MPRTLSSALNFALLAGLAAFALAAFAPGLLNDSDTYWHIRAGEWMLTHHQLLRADPFSFTAAGAPWHTQEWLAEIVMALVYGAGGWSGIHLLFAVFAAAAAGVVGYFVRARVELVPALLATVLGLACVTGSLLARPHLLTLPLLALWTCGLVAARERNTAPSWWLILLMPLWANLHGSFAFGLALAAAFALEAAIETRDRKTLLGWGLFVAAAILSALLTPFGLSGLLFPLHLAVMPGMAFLGEWRPTDFAVVSPFEIALLATLVVLALGKLRLAPARAVLLAGLVWLALAHGRHQMLAGICAPLLLTPALAKAWPAKTRHAKPLLAAAALLVIAVFAAVRLLLPVTRGDDAITPATALAHVPLFVRETPVLNDYAFGGYLIWTGTRPFIDSRGDFYGDIALRNYAALTAPDQDALAATLAFYHVRWTIFAANAPVVKLLDAQPGWHRFYGDKVAVIHVHE